MIIGLRHDIDNVYGLRRGLPKIIFLEERYGVKSTFFIRTDIIRSEKDRRLIRQIEEKGWEIGLHLANTIDTSAMPSPKEELEIMNKLGFQIHGVTPCGKTIGFKGDVTWRTMDSLGLKYMEGEGTPRFRVNTLVMPTHLSFDIYYVRKFGDKNGYQKFKEDLLQKLKKDGIATVLVHPEWFVRTVQSHGLMKIPLTLLRKGMMNKVYETFLSEFKNKVEFKKYIDIY